MHASAEKRLIDIVGFIGDELKDLQNYNKIDYNIYLSDKNTRRLVERIIENIANAIIDIMKITISDKEVEMPDSYAGIMEKGGQLFNLKQDEILNLLQIAKLRNILAHEYLNLKWEKIKKFLDEYQMTVLALIKISDNLITEEIKKSRK